MDSDAGKNLTFGIITFYREQVFEIQRELVNSKIMKTIESAFVINDEYQWLIKDNTKEERLQVGTVDAFQGKEFDVVILSCVRTRRQSNQPMTGTQLFGRICTTDSNSASKNLLCVAMSRQKKLLAVGTKVCLVAQKRKCILLNCLI